MNPKTFRNQLLLVSFCVAAMICIFYFIPALRPFHWFSWFSWLVFILLSILMYVFGKKAALQSRKIVFNNVALGFVMGKLFIAIPLVLGYNALFQPASKLFLLPFFIIYLIFTVFELSFMIKLGKMEGN